MHDVMMGWWVKNQDFLKFEPIKNYDKVIVNPPFTKGTNKRFYLEFLFKSLSIINKSVENLIPQPDIVFISPDIINISKEEEEDKTFGLIDIIKYDGLSPKYLKEILNNYFVISEKEIKQMKKDDELDENLESNFGFQVGLLLGNCSGFLGASVRSRIFYIEGLTSEAFFR